MVAKERTAKFMCDLTSDQETKQLLLTEADYNAACNEKAEISTLQPLSEEETRAEMLNEWNIENDADDEEASCSNSSNIGQKEDFKIHDVCDQSSLYSLARSGRKIRSQEDCVGEAGFCTPSTGKSPASEDGSSDDSTDEGADKYYELWDPNSTSFCITMKKEMKKEMKPSVSS